MKPASLTGSLLMRKGRGVPSLSNSQTQNYESNKQVSVFTSSVEKRTLNKQQDVPVLSCNTTKYVQDFVKPRHLDQKEHGDPGSKGDGHSPIAPVGDFVATVGMGEHRVSTSLRLEESRHLQLRLLAARKKCSLQKVLQTIVHEHLDKNFDGIDCICKSEGD